MNAESKPRKEFGGKPTKVVGADRHSWGFELELECGHGYFHFTTSMEPPTTQLCIDCEQVEDSCSDA